MVDSKHLRCVDGEWWIVNGGEREKRGINSLILLTPNSYSNPYWNTKEEKDGKKDS